ncbi:M28 family peptidase, partial [bacterium]|nr:M28 family peptidase [bacterium]
ERVRTGRPVTVTPSGGTVAVTEEPGGKLARRSHGGFRELGYAIPAPKPRTERAPAPLTRLMERARQRGAGLRDEAAVAAVVDAVRADSLENYVRTLSETPSGAAAKRWWEDSATTGIHTDYIVSKFSNALGAGAVFTHGFDVRNDDGDIVRVHNIVGRKPCGIPGAGAILLTAHMDATGTRSEPVDLCEDGIKDPSSGCDCSAPDGVIDANAACEWDPKLDPSPGADDNATGVAALLEAARLLAPLSFQFDIYFVAFQAEEIGLVGSAAYADSVAGADQDVWAVLNVDMLGYNATLNRLHLMTDASSEWFADWIVESGAEFVPQLPVEKFLEPFGRSDHASFWARGIDAVLLLEDKDLPYPGYHTYFDRWDTMFPASGRPNSELQLLLSVQLTVATFARFALQYTTPDLALPNGELTATPSGGGTDFVGGRTVRLRARVHNLGNSSLIFGNTTVDSLTARVTFHDGNPDAGGTLLGMVEHTALFASGGAVDFDWDWDTSSATPGFHTIHARVEGLDTGYDQREVSAENNATMQTLFLQDASTRSPRILDHYVYPNPVRGGRNELTFYYELTRDCGVYLLVFNLEGEVVGRFQTGESFFFEGNEAGPNKVDGHTIRWLAPDELDPGVYVYSLRTTRNGETTDQSDGKFALLR